MKRYYVLFIAIVALTGLGAALTEKSFRGTGGIGVSSNLNTHVVTVDGSAITGSGIPIQNGAGNNTTLTNPVLSGEIYDTGGNNRIAAIPFGSLTLKSTNGQAVVVVGAVSGASVIGNLSASGNIIGGSNITSTSGTFTGNGSGLTNTLLLKTLTSTNGFWTFTQNSDGTTNAAFTLTNLAGLSGSGSSIDNTLYTNNPSSSLTNFITTLGPWPGTNYFITATNDLNFVHSTNRAGGYTNFAATWFIESGVTNRQIWFNANWKFLGTTNYILIASNKVAVLSVNCYGPSETNLLAVLSVQP